MKLSYLQRDETKKFVLSMTVAERDMLLEKGLDGPLSIRFSKGELIIKPSDTGPSIIPRNDHSFWFITQGRHDARANPARLDMFSATDIPEEAIAIDHGLVVIDVTAFPKSTFIPRKRVTQEVPVSQPSKPTVIGKSFDDLVGHIKDTGEPVTPQEREAAAPVTPAAPTRGDAYVEDGRLFTHVPEEPSERLTWLVDNLNAMKEERNDALAFEIDSEGFLDAIIRVRVGRRSKR